jgi:hypothetical protein
LLLIFVGNVVLPPKRPGLKQNLTAKIQSFCQTAKENWRKVTNCCKKCIFILFFTAIVCIFRDAIMESFVFGKPMIARLAPDYFS